VSNLIQDQTLSDIALYLNAFTDCYGWSFKGSLEKSQFCLQFSFVVQDDAPVLSACVFSNSM